MAGILMVSLASFLVPNQGEAGDRHAAANALSKVLLKSGSLLSYAYFLRSGKD